MTDLFNGMGESLSPREEWMRKHSVHVTESEDGLGPKWVASIPQGLQEESRDGRNDAVARIAQRMHTVLNIRPWNAQ